MIVGVAPCEHVHHEIKLVAGQGPERVTRPYGVKQIVQVQGFKPGHRDQNLGQYVQRTFNGCQGFYIFCEHQLHEYCGFDEIPGMCWIDGAAANVPHPVARAANALDCG